MQEKRAEVDVKTQSNYGTRIKKRPTAYRKNEELQQFNSNISNVEAISHTSNTSQFTNEIIRIGENTVLVNKRKIPIIGDEFNAQRSL